MVSSSPNSVLNAPGSTLTPSDNRSTAPCWRSSSVAVVDERSAIS